MSILREGQVVFKLYSKGCEYALRALTSAAAQNDNGRFQAKSVCAAAGIPESFSRKTFQALVQAGFLAAIRGPGGGYRLIRPMSKITLLDVIQAVDGKDTFDHCVMGMPMCGSAHPCPLHGTWANVKTELLAQLKRQTLEDLAKTAQLSRRTRSRAGGRKTP